MADDAPRTQPDKPVRILINPPVFFGSAGTIVGFSLFAIVFPEIAAGGFGTAQAWILDTFGWLYALAVAGFVIFCAVLAFGETGKIKLGPDHAEPEYSYPSWFAMLFSAGMGIGLMFFGVAEPILHFSAPPTGDGGTLQAARDAMVTTFFHWGIHAWAIYAVVGLSLAYFSFRHGLPLTIRSALHPLIGDRIHGPIGHAVDIFAVVGTVLGVATSLGFGVAQINSGLAFLIGIEESVTMQVVLIVTITLIATGSVMTGLDKGVRRLSELNLGLAFVLLLFVAVLGSTTFLLQATVQNLGAYLSQFVDRTFRLYAYEPNSWLNDWTLFYWAWWISWSPFVGMFIARISRGRTIRQFIVGVLLVPLGVTAVWFTVFGNSAIALDLGVAAGAISAAAAANTPVALFTFLQYFPFAGVTSVIAVILVVIFFVTSSDSGSLVVDTITAGGRDDAPVWQRIFWAMGEGLVAIALLLAGGLGALQAATLIGALPFTIVMLFVCYGLWKGLADERIRAGSERLPVPPAGGKPISWQKRLSILLDYPTRQKAEAFLSGPVREALDAVAAEMQTRSVDAKVSSDEKGIALETGSREAPEAFRYAVRVRAYHVPDFAMRDLPPSRGDERRRYYRAEVYLRQGGRNYDVMDYTREQIIADVLTQYERHLHAVHLGAG
ncbi:BCCT family transporter [Arsenicitalea aurantiaca]|uniref:BCCT family transporter n=1 Tax=Arsenicitalea aurantiaca TaxID=1783274 RepID=A0A433XG21_9HYPH|nr:choline BCCT transporter BetT [Arsenicitalea aurantiaca]RUT32898.1 BCCT family transporter [Arsenicitalea aurantiaca]